ncbi:nSTAND1 domain-containing NTPase [Bacteroides timonensis]|uniref:nSTAND1 domain-containing NTPase n=1 Tax=Bacteroides timonensis TaxID=1470345 RepID=UPI0004BBD494|nr:ATP-binding protein [Bacteroides timonensis]
MDNYISDETFLEDERIIEKSGVRRVFTPHTPINDISLFKGRTVEVRQILSTLNTPGQHVLLFGERGVGKSSLANVTSKQIVNITNKHLISKKCSKTDNFKTIVEKVLIFVGVNPLESRNSKRTEIGFSGAAFETSRELSGYEDRLNSPSWVAEKIKDANVLFLIDEFDSIKEESDKFKIAELVKLLSDYNSDIKLFIVGIAETSSKLTQGHPSVQRCLKEIKLQKMQNEELFRIIVDGEQKLGIEFSRESRRRICVLSSGYAHFTHLIALKASEEAIINNQPYIDLPDVNRAIEKSVDECVDTLSTSYKDAISSFSASTIDKYRKILYAISLCNDEFIRSAEIRKEYSRIFKENITQGTLNNFLSKIVASDTSKLLKRLGKGVYRFNDPRMISYIKLIQSDLFAEYEMQLLSEQGGL